MQRQLAVPFENTIGQRQSRSHSSRPTVTPPPLRDQLPGRAGDRGHCGDIGPTATFRTGRGAGGRTAVSLTQDPPLFGVEPSELNGGTTQWTLFRPLNRAGKPGPPEQHDHGRVGWDVAFHFATGRVLNPLLSRRGLSFGAGPASGRLRSSWIAVRFHGLVSGHLGPSCSTALSRDSRGWLRRDRSERASTMSENRSAASTG
jgi:hypothetical protein